MGAARSQRCVLPRTGPGMGREMPIMWVDVFG